MDMFEFLNFYVILGIVFGFIYVFGVVGIMLIFVIFCYVYLVYGDLVMLGVFIVLVVVISIGIFFMVVLLIVVIVMVVVVVGIDKVFYDYLCEWLKIVMVMVLFGIVLMICVVI